MVRQFGCRITMPQVVKETMNPKEKEHVKKCIQENHDAILLIGKDIEYIKKEVKGMSEGVKTARAEIKNLGDNYVVFKTKILAYWGFALIIISTIVNKGIDKLF